MRFWRPVVNWPINSNSPYNKKMNILKNTSALMMCLFFFLLFFGGCSSNLPDAAFLAPASLPTKGKAEAIGSYSKGCLKGGVTFQKIPVGLELSQVKKGRFWGHPHLIDYLENLGKTIHQKRRRHVIVGDLSLARGGPTVGGHNSHQSGLDVDLWFDMPKSRRSFHQRESSEMTSILEKQNLKLTSYQVEMVQHAASHPKVERIFIHPLLKKDLCERNLLNAKLLRKVRPWYGHDDHIHVRLQCPKDSLECTPQQAPPVGSGCDKLSWWFSEEAKKSEASFNYSWKATKSKYKKTLESLPVSCESIYSQNF